MDYHQYLVRYDLQSAQESLHEDHPQVEMKKLSKQFHFNVENWEPVSIADCWLFWLGTYDKNLILPSFITQLEYCNYYDWTHHHV
jgi:hypothetical protein